MWALADTNSKRANNTCKDQHGNRRSPLAAVVVTRDGGGDGGQVWCEAPCYSIRGGELKHLLCNVCVQ